MSIFAEHPVHEALRKVYTTELIYTSRALALSESNAWHRLLHYDKFLGNLKSEAREKTQRGFFLSERGLKDPRSELEATIEALFLETEGAEPARCRFPAREIFLVERLKIDSTRLPPVNCVAYRDWLAHVDAESASIVFASYFMGNASSMFGHTFLRFHGKRNVPLLDSAFNYAANPTTENALLYAWLGMTGGFPGTFSMHPYYQKINEYTDLESRDLWEYRLNLTPAETRYLLAHLWELSNAYFPYFYLDENCSYQLLTVLEAVRPDKTLTSRFSAYVAPSDTLRTLEGNGFFTGNTAYRASIFTRLTEFYHDLSGEEKALFDLWRKDFIVPQTMARSEARVADTVLEFYRFKNEYTMETWPPKDMAHYKAMLAARSQFDDKGEHEKLIQITPGQNPLKGMPTMQAWSGGIYNGEQPGILIGIRPALRELMDVSIGYPQWSQIQIFSGQLAVFPGKSADTVLRLEEFHVVDIFSLAPWEAAIRKFSYRLRTGAYNHFELSPNSNQQQLSWDSLAAGGISLLPFRHIGVFVMAQAEVQVSGIWSETARLTPGVIAGFKATWSPRMATLIYAEYARALISNTGDTYFVTFKQNVGILNTAALEADVRIGVYQAQVVPRYALYAKVYF